MQTINPEIITFDEPENKASGFLMLVTEEQKRNFRDMVIKAANDLCRNKKDDNNLKDGKDKNFS